LGLIVAITASISIVYGGDNRNGKNGVPTPNKTTFTDSRDGKSYKKVKIGNHVWMAENLNYDVPGDTTDVCYERKSDSCAKYGRLYSWFTTMNGVAISNAIPSGIQGVCPVGWHLPSDEEWRTLTGYCGNSLAVGTTLKSSTDWNSYAQRLTGTDVYSFSALPGGYGSGGGYF
jgi:uncharacterized protein (TIGR02145 family)